MFKYPKNLAETSLDLQLLLVFHISMMVLMLIGPILNLLIQISIVAALLLVLLILGLIKRLTSGWYWPGVGFKEAGLTVLQLALGAFFLFAAAQRFPPFNPACFPWYSGGGGIILFSALVSLKLATPLKSEFLAQCIDPGQLQAPGNDKPQTPDESALEPQWKKVARGVFMTYFLAIWLAFVCFMWQSAVTMKKGATAPTATQTESYTESRKTVYITRGEKRLLTTLEYTGMLGIPSVFLVGALLHFVLEVKVIPNAPTFRELWEREGSGAENEDHKP